MKEIGSEFWTGCTPTDASSDFLMHPTLYNSFHTVETLSGRTALEHIVEHLVTEGKQSVYMPAYCCHTMIEPFDTHGMKVKFYDVVLTERGLKREFDKDNNCDVVFLMDYFGHIDAETADIARDQKSKGKTRVYDATHSMYSPFESQMYDYIFGSYRKWVDINCGFIAQKDKFYQRLTQNSNSEDKYHILRQRCFDLKALYMSGRISDKKEFLSLIDEAESYLEENYHHKMPDNRSLAILRDTDAKFIRKRRCDNGAYLTSLINEIGSKDVRCFNTSITDDETPLFIPIYVNLEKRNDLKRYLIQKDIYCPVHWPLSELHKISEKSKELYQSELSIICDQRYDRDDMERIAESITDFLKK